MTRFLGSFLALAFLLVAVAPSDAQVQYRLGDPQADFPPGVFTDGGQYKISDFKDKLVVLFFFESTCPRCRASIAERSQIVKAFKGKPIKFLAVGANITLPQAQMYQNQTGLAMPIFADGLGIMQARYGFKISLQNIWQMRIVGTNGGLEAVDMDRETIEKVLKKTGVQPRYNVADYDKQLRPALELLEFGQYGQGVKALTAYTKTSNKTVAESAKKLCADVKEEAAKWKVDAEFAAGIEPLKAYDLYQKVAAALPGDVLGKASLAEAKKLAADKTIAPELGARKAFAALAQNMGQMTSAGRPLVMQTCKSIMKKYPGTPTAEKAEDLYKELGGKVPGGKELGGKSGK